MASDAKTLISMSLKDEASRQLKTFERNWKNTIGNISQDGGLEGAIDGFINSGLGKLTGGIAGMFAAGKLTQTVVELGKMGTEAQRTRGSFDELAAGVSQSADAMLAAMRTATGGTVADSELMLAANRAMMLEVADNAEEMSGLMAAAIERGRALGVSASQAVGDVITGIGRMSPEILDNLGIVGAAAAFDTYAASLGKTADQLTDVERKQALVNAVLADSSGAAVIDDAAAAFERMDASIQNAKEAMGILFGPAVAAIADRLAEAATITAQALTADPLVQAEATISGRVQRLLKEAQDAAMVSVAPGAPVGPEGLAGGQLSDQAQRLQLVLFAIQQVDAAQRDNISSAGEWADQITRIAERVVTFGDVSDGTLRQVAILLGNISTTTAAETIQRTAEAMGALSDATRPTAEQIAATNAAIANTGTVVTSSASEIAQVSAAAQAGIQGIARGVAAVQGDQAGVDWLTMMNRLIDDQAAKWLETGYTVNEITGVLLPGYIDKLRQVADGSRSTATALDISAIVDRANGSLTQMAQQLATINGVDSALAWLEDAQSTLETMAGEWEKQGYTVEQITGVVLPNYLAGLDQIVQKEIQAAAFGEQIGQRIAAGLGVAIGAANQLMGALGSAMGFALDAITGLANDAMPALNSQASTMVDTMGPDGALGWLETQTQEVIKQKVAWLQAGYEPEYITNVLMPNYLSNLRSANKQIDTMKSGFGGAASGVDNLTSKVASIISGATTLDAGLDPAAFLPREDAINENARRLAAIMRDGIGNQDWLGEFQSEVPGVWEELVNSGNPQQAAARMLQEFQQGLRPELLDKEQIKERVKAMLLGESNSAALAQEIAAELSGELGMSLAQAQQAVAGVMGVGGAGAGAGAQVGPDGGAQGTQFVTAWAGTVKSQLAEFENTGKQAGSSWGAGFMATVEAGVPGQLIGLLVALVTPGVMATMAAQGSRTGAQ